MIPGVERIATTASSCSPNCYCDARHGGVWNKRTYSAGKKSIHIAVVCLLGFMSSQSKKVKSAVSILRTYLGGWVDGYVWWGRGFEGFGGV